jgi:hypothetical protein
MPGEKGSRKGEKCGRDLYDIREQGAVKRGAVGGNPDDVERQNEESKRRPRTTHCWM